MIRRTLLVGAVLGLGLAPGLACRGQEDAAQCHRDGDCPTGSACLAQLCVARVGANPEVWSVEVTPGNGPRFASREFPDFPFTQVPAELVLDRKILMATLLEQKAPDLDLVGDTAVHVVVSVRSAIAGRADLQFEAEGMSRAPEIRYLASVPIPSMLLHTAASMAVIPIPPLDRSMPPWLLPVTLDSALPALDLPAGPDVVVLQGKLEAADPQAPLEAVYQARARLQGRLVSNAAVADDKGAFTVRMQRSVLPPDGAGLTLELSPADDGVPLPSLVLGAVDLTKTTLPPLRLPAVQKPETYVVPVVGGRDKVPVVGATVRFRAVLTGTGTGQAVYQRAAQTDIKGNATLPLIPGATQATRDYVVQVIPPADSEFAAGCVAEYSIGPATTPGGQRVGAGIELGTKMSLEGHVLRADGKPAGSVRIHAARLAGSSAAACGDLIAAPADQTSDSDGRYKMLLDPGQYRLDVEPPQAVPLPTTSVVVTVTDSMTTDITLPLPVLVEGRVMSPDHVPVADAEVRAFSPGPTGEIVRRAVALTDVEGKFRLILPRH